RNPRIPQGRTPRIMEPMQLPTGGHPRRRPWIPLALLAGLSLLLSACGQSGYTFVGSTADHVFVKVPSDWQGYNESTILKAIGLDGTPSAKSFHWLAGYDGSPA